MKSIFSLCAVSVVLAFASNVNGSIETGDTFAANSTLSTAAVQDAYIIKLRPGNQLAQFSAQGNGLMPSRQKVQYTYETENFQGFASKLTSEQLKRLQDDERVEYVEPQQIMRIAAIQNNPPSWGLPRVSNRRSGVGQAYNYPNSAGAGTEIWVIDTGVYAEHKDFGGRAKMVKSFIDGEPAIDLNGHGTHVAGTTAGTTYGLAKKAKIFGVKVLSGSGSGSNAGVIAGIQYATRYARRYKSVINMSLSGGKSRAVDDAVNAAVNAGVAVVVAAGNSATDSCNYSPSGASRGFSVAASDINNRQATFSCYGRCVDVYAPGVDIKSTWKGSNTATNTISGTSMASPHVAGVAALYMGSKNYWSVDALYADLINYSTKNAITNPTQGTANRLVYNQLY